MIWFETWLLFLILRPDMQKTLAGRFAEMIKGGFASHPRSMLLFPRWVYQTSSSVTSVKLSDSNFPSFEVTGSQWGSTWVWATGLPLMLTWMSADPVCKQWEKLPVAAVFLLLPFRLCQCCPTQVGVAEKPYNRKLSCLPQCIKSRGVKRRLPLVGYRLLVYLNESWRFGVAECLWAKVEMTNHA